MHQSEESNFWIFGQNQESDVHQPSQGEGFSVKDGEFFFQTWSPMLKNHGWPLMEESSEIESSFHLNQEEKKIDFQETGIDHEEPSSEGTPQIKGKKRKDQNVSRGLSRKYFKALEKSHNIQPKIKRDPKTLGDIRFILILIRIVPFQRRQQTLEPLYLKLKEAYNKNSEKNHEGTRKELELMRIICEGIDLSDEMDISENLRIMRQAGKVRKPTEVNPIRQVAEFLEFQQNERKKMNII